MFHLICLKYKRLPAEEKKEQNQHCNFEGGNGTKIEWKKNIKKLGNSENEMKKGKKAEKGRKKRKNE